MATNVNRMLDEIGWDILAALQANARVSFSDLGRRVGLSAPAVADRVRRMEDAGIIAGYRAALSPEKLGYSIIAMIRISAPEENCVRLGTLVRGLPGVVESLRVTGTDRLMVKVVVPSVAHLDIIVNQLSRYGTATAAIVLSSRSHTLGRPMQARDGHPKKDRAV
jgi:Lrp/AsnC family transcriptional regulator, leucine-responsive regulatory protein